MTKVEIDVNAIIADAYTINDDEAAAVRYVLENGLDLDFDKMIESADEDFTSLLESDETANEEERLDYIKGQIESEILNHDLEEPGRYSNAYTLKSGRTEYSFATEEDAHTIAREYLISSIDEGLISMETIKASWESGQTMAEWVDEAIRIDGLGHFLSSYDGNCEEFTTMAPSREDWIMWRTN